MLLPVIGVLQAGDQAMGDRFTYLPSIGLFLAAAWVVPELLPANPPARRALAAATIAILALLAVDTRVPLAYWRDSLSLWQRSLAVSPDWNFRAHGGIAHAIDDEPGHPDWHAAAARLFARMGQRADAIRQLRAALAIDPSYEPARLVLEALNAK
jgi:tetratricopeptide (TPR) repeat protein